MNRSTLIARIAAASFTLNAVLHASAFKQVTNDAAKGGDEVREVTAVLWLVFAIGMILFALIVLLEAKAPSPHRRTVLILAGCFPIATAALQFIYLGFIIPEVLLVLTGTLTIVAAVVPMSSEPARAS